MSDDPPDALELWAAPEPDKKERAKPDHAEHALSHWVDVLLDRVMLGDCWYTAVETGTWMVSQSPEARMNAENKRRARGVKPAHLDWYAYQRLTGLYVQWELKVESRPLRRGQRDTITALRRNNIATGVFETVPAVCDFLLGAGFMMHANARNIALELHERYLAKRREHAAGVKPKNSRPRPSKRLNVSVSQGHKMGAWKL